MCTTSALASGTHSILATYGGDPASLSSSNTPLTQVVQVTTTGKADFTWAAQPNAESRALQRELAGRIAACRYGSGNSFNFDVGMSMRPTTPHFSRWVNELCNENDVARPRG